MDDFTTIPQFPIHVCLEPATQLEPAPIVFIAEPSAEDGIPRPGFYLVGLAVNSSKRIVPKKRTLFVLNFCPFCGASLIFEEVAHGPGQEI